MIDRGSTKKINDLKNKVIQLKDIQSYKLTIYYERLGCV